MPDKLNQEQSLYNQIKNPNTYVDGYGVTRTVEISPIAKTIKTFNNWLSGNDEKTKQAIEKYGKPVTGTVPIPSLEYDYAIRLKQLHDYCKAVQSSKLIKDWEKAIKLFKNMGEPKAIAWAEKGLANLRNTKNATNTVNAIENAAKLDQAEKALIKSNNLYKKWAANPEAPSDPNAGWVGNYFQCKNSGRIKL